MTDTEQALRDLLTEIRRELDDRYDGAPDSRSRWMGPLMRDIDAALARSPAPVERTS